MKERDLAPDAVKGLCIILMVFGHVTYVGIFSKFLSSVNHFIYTFHMPVFLLISGYFFHYRSNLKNKLENIFRKTLIPYFIFISLYLVGLIIVKLIGIETSNEPPESFFDFIYTIFLHPYGGYWFLHSLIVIQLGMIISACFVNKMFPKEDNEATSLLLTMFVLLLLSEAGIVSFRTVSYFLFGNLIRTSFKNGFSISFVLALSVTSIVLLSDNLSIINIYNIFSPSEVIWCLCITSLFWSTFKLFNSWLTASIFAWVGRNTLIILVLHAAFIVGMKPLNKVFLAIDNTGILQSIAVTIITVASCLVSAKISDRTKISKYIFGQERIYSKVGLTKT